MKKNENICKLTNKAHVSGLSIAR